MAVQPTHYNGRLAQRPGGSIPRQAQAQPQPTAAQRETAARIHETHRRICVPEAVCRHCLRTWPCAASRWADMVELRSPGTRRGPAA